MDNQPIHTNDPLIDHPQVRALYEKLAKIDGQVDEFKQTVGPIMDSVHKAERTLDEIRREFEVKLRTQNLTVQELNMRAQRIKMQITDAEWEKGNLSRELQELLDSLHVEQDRLDQESKWDAFMDENEWLWSSVARPFQKQGIKFMAGAQGRGLHGVLNADQMGLGKTLMAEATIDFLQFEKRITDTEGLPPSAFSVLWLCPASIKATTVTEIKKWNSNRPVHALDGVPGLREQVVKLGYDNGMTLVCNYEQLRSTPSIIWEKEPVLSKEKERGYDYAKGRYTFKHKVISEGVPRQWSIIILDEAHKFKNDSTSLFGLVEEICRNAGLIFPMTGPQPLTAKVLTPTGWVRMGDLSIGDKLFGHDGRVGNVTGIFPQGVKPVFKVQTSDGSETRCTDDHLWTVHKYSDRSKSQTMSLLEMRIGGLKSNVNTKWALPALTPPEFDEVPLPIDPYLMGLLLTDGCFSNGGVSFSNSDSTLLSSVRAIIEQDWPMLSLKDAGHDSFRITNIKKTQRTINPLLDVIRLLGLAEKRGPDKFVPDVYKFSSVKSRLTLLQGMMDGDGTPGSGATFYSESPQLLSDMQFLVRSLGGTSSNRFKRNQNITVSLPAEFNQFGLIRKNRIQMNWTRTRGPVHKITAIELDGEEEVMCISTNLPEQLYITDDCIVTHNTPIMNRPEEFWAILHMLTLKGKFANKFADKDRFINEYCFSYGFETSFRPQAAESLMKSVSNMVIRRRKDEVLKELPPKVHTIRTVVLLEEQRRLYNMMRDRFYVWLDEQTKNALTAPILIAQFTRLRQLALYPKGVHVIGPDEKEVSVDCEESAKLDEALDIFDELHSNEQKVLVFSSYKEVLTEFKNRIEIKFPGVEVGMITGDANSAQKAVVQERFTDPDDSMRVCCGTIRAMGIGLNLQGACSDAIFLDLDWSPGANEQAEDRLHRQGQVESVNIHIIQGEGTIDLYIADKLRRKTEMTSSVIERDELRQALGDGLI